MTVEFTKAGESKGGPRKKEAGNEKQAYDQARDYRKRQDQEAELQAWQTRRWKNLSCRRPTCRKSGTT